MKISSQKKEIIFIGLNPSLSDQIFIDKTTKKIINISANYNYGKIKIINLFGLISKSPKLLLAHKDPIGFLNNKVILESFKYWSYNLDCDLWLGWGNNGNLYNRNHEIHDWLTKFFYIKKNSFISPSAPLFKKTKTENPIHPLYCANNSKLKQYIL